MRVPCATFRQGLETAGGRQRACTTPNSECPALNGPWPPAAASPKELAKGKLSGLGRSCKGGERLTFSRGDTKRGSALDLACGYITQPCENSG